MKRVSLPDRPRPRFHLDSTALYNVNKHHAQPFMTGLTEIDTTAATLTALQSGSSLNPDPKPDPKPKTKANRTGFVQFDWGSGVRKPNVALFTMSMEFVHPISGDMVNNERYPFYFGIEVSDKPTDVPNPTVVKPASNFPDLPYYFQVKDDKGNVYHCVTKPK